MQAGTPACSTVWRRGVRYCTTDLAKRLLGAVEHDLLGIAMRIREGSCRAQWAHSPMRSSRSSYAGQGAPLSRVHNHGGDGFGARANNPPLRLARQQKREAELTRLSLVQGASHCTVHPLCHCAVHPLCCAPIVLCTHCALQDSSSSVSWPTMLSLALSLSLS